MLELGIGVAVVLLVVTALLNFWNVTFSGVNQSRLLDDFELTAEIALNRLVETRGDPLDWSSVTDFSEVKAVGIARYPLVVDEEKLAALMLHADEATHPVDYNRIRQILGLRNADFKLQVYEIAIDITPLQADAGMGLLTPLGNPSGKLDTTGETYIIQKQRYVTIGEDARVIRMYFYLPKQR
jgi:hypothetical protein